MSAGNRGGIIFGIIIAMSAVFCYFVPFVLLPNLEMAMALPVIQLPGEILIKDVPFIGNFTNTAVGIILADIAVIAIALIIRNPKLVPEGFQNFFEIIIEYLYGLAKQVAGEKTGTRIFPLVASIFLIVLMANWIELIPGVDSVGLIHCAPEGKQGYPIRTDDGEFKTFNFLKVSEVGIGADKEIATEADYHACEAKWFGIVEHDEEAESSEEDPTHTEDEGATEGEADTAENTEATNAEDAEDGEHDEAVTTEDHSEGGDAAEEGHGEANADLFVVTPFVRAAATDLNMTLALALISFFTIQFYGVRELGIGYFAKFINLPALGSMGENPMGLMDFAVGLLEIVSELSKILSFGFRLFGNIFAGQVLLFVMAFLVATLLPVGFYGLEIFVGLIQAYVFFMLTLVFSGMATISHHGDDDHDH